MFGTKRSDTIQDRAEEFFDDAGKNLSEFGREARHKADHAKKDMVKTLHDAAHTIRREARDANVSRDVRSHADGVAHGFEQAARYLNRHSYEDIGDDITEGVKANPWRTLALIFVIGLVIGLILRGDDNGSSAQAYQRNAHETYRRP